MKSHWQSLRDVKRTWKKIEKGDKCRARHGIMDCCQVTVTDDKTNDKKNNKILPRPLKNTYTAQDREKYVSI